MPRRCYGPVLLLVVLACGASVLASNHGKEASVEKQGGGPQMEAFEDQRELKPAEATHVEEEERLHEKDSEEEHPGGHHEEEHPGEHHEEHHASELTKTVSFLLLGFMVINFVMLWLVNWPDAHIRAYTWAMISSTISIYMAVLIDSSSTHLFEHLVHPSASPEEIPFEVTLVIRLLMFVGAVVLANVLNYTFRKKKKILYATKTIGGHLVGFAGIGTFSAICHEGTFPTKVLAAVLILLVIFVFRAVTFATRSCIFGAEEGLALTSPSHAKHNEEENEWRESVAEAEDEGCSIVASYVVYRMVMSSFQRSQHEMLLHHTSHDLVTIAAIMGGFVVLLFVQTYMKRCLDKCNHNAKAIPTSAYSRTMASLQTASGMSMSWFSLLLFLWGTMTVLPGISHELNEIISAAVLTAAAIVAILILDCIADKIDMLDGTAQHEQQEGQSPLSRNVSSRKYMLEVAERAKKTASGLRQAFGASDTASTSLIDQENIAHVQKAIFDTDNMERAIRTVIGALALAVGLSWEKAFHAALTTVIETTPAMKKHFVLSEGALAAANCLLIMPAWLMFVVPKAKRTPHDHHRLLDEERKLEE